MLVELLATHLTVIAAYSAVSITTDLSRSYSIMGEHHLNRTAFFNLHGNLGAQPDTHAWMEEKAVNLYKWIPSRGFLTTEAAPEDPENPGYTSPAYWTSTGLKNWRFKNAFARFPDLEHSQVLCNKPGRFPSYMGDLLYNAQRDLVKGRLTPTDDTAYANISMYAVSNLVRYSSPVPAYFEFMNEPSSAANWGYHWDPVAYDFLLLFCNTLGTALHQKFPDIKICAPTYAWPYMEANNFNGWEQRYAKFAYSPGLQVDCYAQHLYERDYSSREGAMNQYAAQYSTDNKILSQGKLIAHLDLIDNYRYKNTGGSLPKYVFTEAAALIYSNTNDYPRKNDITLWTPADFFNASKVMSTMILQLMDRPDRTEKFIPFINLRADNWTSLPNYPWVLFQATPGGTNESDYTETEFANFLKMWSDVKGDYLLCTSGDSEKVLSKSFVSSNSVYVIAQNIYSNTITTSFTNISGTNVISSYSRKRYRMSSTGNVYFYDWAPWSDPSNVTLLPDELFILRANLASGIQYTAPHVDERLYYANKYMVYIGANKVLQFGMTLPMPLPAIEYAYLDIGLSRDNGFSSNPTYVRINDTYDLTIPNLSRSIGINDYWKTTRIAIPVQYLKNGYNTAQIKFASGGGYATSCKIVLGQK